MPDEAGYVSHLVTREVANERLYKTERMILAAALEEWLRSIEIDEHIRSTATRLREEGQNQL
jgi:hypothetical protein